jgi:hypothetical protein
VGGGSGSLLILNPCVTIHKIQTASLPGRRFRLNFNPVWHDLRNSKGTTTGE